ncbi:hypothetical protein ANCDUO_10466 [Ancylostoma duodenale]|uniref:Uncharacterized protein n=1 Tax=Ancylostoma duodenale TaxID=51022 RepID=A0A0C2GDT1_9BILA|nr:hypothetical protein ANCDUO_10466 [Ancylostoma duodenale]
MQLLTSSVVWSIAGSAFAHNFITVGTVTYLPLYYKTVLNMSLTSVVNTVGIDGAAESPIAKRSHNPSLELPRMANRAML